MPQGLIIGWLLFILFISDLPLAIDKGDNDIYTDVMLPSAQDCTRNRTTLGRWCW